MEAIFLSGAHHAVAPSSLLQRVATLDLGLAVPSHRPAGPVWPTVGWSADDRVAGPLLPLRASLGTQPPSPTPALKEQHCMMTVGTESSTPSHTAHLQRLGAGYDVQQRSFPKLRTKSVSKPRSRGDLRNDQTGLDRGGKAVSEDQEEKGSALYTGEELCIDLGILDAVLQDRITQRFYISSGSKGAATAGVWPNSPAVDGAGKSVPVRVISGEGCTAGVVATATITCGAEVGPVVGRRLSHTHPDFTRCNHRLWEVYGDDGEVTHFLVADGGCWMAYVRDATSDDQQNLEVVQRGGEIYYRALRNIHKDEELLVWYSPTVSSFLGIPLFASSWENQDISSSGDKQYSLSVASVGKGHLQCTVCKRGFNSRSNLRSHMRTHTLHRPFKCDFCQRGFSQSSTLRNHIRLHTGEKPYKCLVCHSAYSQLAGLRAHQKSARHRPRAGHETVNLLASQPQ